VRQRWKSIEAAFLQHKQAVESFDPVVMERKQAESDQSGVDASQENGECYASLSEFGFILEKVSMSEGDTELLFSRIDIDGDGKLTAMEFMRGVRIFAPSCALEDLRLRCITLYGSVHDAFGKLSPNRIQEAHTLASFQKLLEDVDLVVETQSTIIFDIVARRSGHLYINDLIIALNTAAPGVNVMLTPRQRGRKVEKQVSEFLTPFQHEVGEHRQSVRRKVAPRPKDLPMGSTAEPGSYYCSSANWQNTWGMTREPKRKKPLQSSASAPTLPPVTTSPALARSSSDMQQPRRRPPPPEWSQVNHSKTMSLLRSCSPDPYTRGDEDYRDGVEEYFVHANSHLADSDHLLGRSHPSRLAQFRELKQATALT